MMTNEIGIASLLKDLVKLIVMGFNQTRAFGYGFRAAASEELHSPSFSPESTVQVDTNTDGNQEAALGNHSADCTSLLAGASHENHSSGSDFYVCDHSQSSMDKTKDRFLEALLMVSSFLLSFATAGAFYFTRALTIVGSHDPVLKHSLAALNKVFAASFFSNFLGLLVTLILQSRREYHLYKKYTLILSNTASFLFMVLGYGLLVSFNIQYP